MWVNRETPLQEGLCIIQVDSEHGHEFDIDRCLSQSCLVELWAGTRENHSVEVMAPELASGEKVGATIKRNCGYY